MSSQVPKESLAELRKAFHTLSTETRYISNAGETTASRRLKKKTRTNKKTFYY